MKNWDAVDAEGVCSQLGFLASQWYAWKKSCTIIIVFFLPLQLHCSQLMHKCSSSSM